MKNAKLRINDCIYLTYDYRMTIMIREYEICTEHKTSLHHTSSDIEAPFRSMR